MAAKKAQGTGRGTTATKRVVETPANVVEAKRLTDAARSLVVSADKSVRDSRIAAARAAHAVEVAGLVGKGGEWSSWNDYAERGLGYARGGGGITGLRRLGKALALGIDPDGRDSEVWGLYSTKAGTKEFGALVEDPRATAAKARRQAKRSGARTAGSPRHGAGLQRAGPAAVALRASRRDRSGVGQD
jgi:hypothetical protein